MTIPDPISEIVALLRADAAVATLAGENVYGGGLPVILETTMPEAAIVVSPAGGPGRLGYNRYRRTRVDTTCYGETLRESWLLHLAAREVLEELRRDGSLFWAEISSDGANALDPQTQWPTCFASYIVMSATEA